MFLNIQDRVIWDFHEIQFDPTVGGEPATEIVQKVFDAVSEQMQKSYPSRIVEEVKVETYRDKLH